MTEQLTQDSPVDGAVADPAWDILRDVFEECTGTELSAGAAEAVEAGVGGSGELYRIFDLAAQWFALEIEVREDDEVLAEGSFFRQLAILGGVHIMLAEAVHRGVIPHPAATGGLAGLFREIRLAAEAREREKVAVASPALTPEQAETIRSAHRALEMRSRGKSGVHTTTDACKVIRSLLDVLADLTGINSAEETLL